jgi:hypothetical protein
MALEGVGEPNALGFIINTLVLCGYIGFAPVIIELHDRELRTDAGGI